MAKFSPEQAQTVIDTSVNTIYVAGFSFVLGSMFTILLLMLLDFMRRNQPPTK